ncbi:DUF1810 domain-containing protein [Aeromicrobium endophyticum]|uniref:DUF1810 domain-containing protein n=1 Tax=Aeromicrobium endophyticum TaxID=2292704 RepID=A0A371P4G0_9ACTN|nr:DUF1810 domain-containing protein [Aeromicrobium endophyticum]REK70827.1 DUF1810 domain-containing protein [Aeromicrobium endophyticum]
MTDADAADPADPYGLQRFVDAQAGGTYEQALGELTTGAKTSHWMWFVFPQVGGLGRSEMSVLYALSGVDEAAAYWAHPVLGPRYEQCCRALLDLGDVSMTDVLGTIDVQKLHSSLTLFSAAVPQTATFEMLLTRHFDGRPDPATLSLV